MILFSETTIHFFDFIFRDNDPYWQEDTVSEATDSKASYKDIEEYDTGECFSINKSKGMADDVRDKDDVFTEYFEPNMTCDELKAGIESDEALCLTDSDEKSLQSNSSIIDRIVENETRFTMLDNVEDNIPSGDIGGQSSEAVGPVQVSREKEEIITQTPLPCPSKVFQSKSPVKECTDPFCAPDCLVIMKHASPRCTKPSQTQKKPDKESYRDHEEPHNRTINDEDPFEVNEINGEDLLPSATPLQVSPPPTYKSKVIRVPKPSLPQNSGICFLFINRGYCDRHDCSYSHKVLLALLILTFREET